MIFINNLLYKLGTSFEENNIDLKLYEDYNLSKCYRSYRYSEIYLFGKTFESICYLWFSKNKLITIEYMFPIKYLQLFISSINEELSINNKLAVDPNIPKYKYYVYQNKIGTCMISSRCFWT